MGKKKEPYTPEQIAQLSANPYTHAVNPYRVSFTLEFKEFFAEKMKLPEMTTRKIFEMAGYDTSLFTTSQLDCFRALIRNELRSGTGLKPPRGLTYAEQVEEFAKKDLSRQHTKTSIRELQNRVVHLEAEVEFLKKISHLKK